MKFIKSFSSFINESNKPSKLGNYRDLPEWMFTIDQGGIPFWMRRKDEAIDGMWTCFKLQNRFPGIVGGSEIKTENNPSGTIEIRSCKNAIVDGDPRIYEPEDENKGKGLYLEYNTYHEQFLRPGYVLNKKKEDVTNKCYSKINSGIDKDVTYFIPWGVTNPYREEKGLKTIVANSQTSSIEYVGKDAIKLSGLFTSKHAEVINEWLKETIAGSDTSKFNLTVPVKYRLVGGSKGDTYTVNVNPLPGEFYSFAGHSIPLDLGRGKNYEDKIGEIYSSSIESGKTEIWIDIFNYERGASSVSLIFENFPIRWNIPEHELTETQASELKLKWEPGMTVEVKHTTAESNYTWVRFAKEDLEKRLKSVEPFYINNDKISNRQESINVKTNALEKFKTDIRFARAKMSLFINDHKRYAMWMDKHIYRQTDENIEKWNAQVELYNKMEAEKNDEKKLEIFSQWFLENKEKDIHWNWMTS